MSKDKSQRPPAANPNDLPAVLLKVMQTASAGAVPYASAEEEALVPLLFQWLTPMIVADPRYKGEGKPPKALREPLYMVAWDRRAGVWKASISDKVLNVTGTCSFTNLATIIQDSEAGLRDGKWVWGQKKVT